LGRDSNNPQSPHATAGLPSIQRRSLRQKTTRWRVRMPVSQRGRGILTVHTWARSRAGHKCPLFMLLWSLSPARPNGRIGRHSKARRRREPGCGEPLNLRNRRCGTPKAAAVVCRTKHKATDECTAPRQGQSDSHRPRAFRRPATLRRRASWAPEVDHRRKPQPSSVIDRRNARWAACRGAAKGEDGMLRLTLALRSFSEAGRTRRPVPTEPKGEDGLSLEKLRKPALSEVEGPRRPGQGRRLRPHLRRPNAPPDQPRARHHRGNPTRR
jgi:hypothetical protein